MNHKDGLVYAFRHMVSSYDSEDAHHADSGDEAERVMDELLLSESEKWIVEKLAEEVAGNWEFTGKADEWNRRIEAGEV